MILALRWPETRVTLLDATAKRTAFLASVLPGLGLLDRVEVVTARAEDAGREPTYRHRFDLVVARSFGAPAVTAECGAPFVQVTGLLVVAEPPGGDEARWPAAGLVSLGLVDEGVVVRPEATVRRLRAASACDAGYPRANGVPAKRPLF